MLLVKVAWRNVWRHRGRSLVLIASIAFGLWAAIFLMGFYFGVVEVRIESAIRTEISHIQLHHPEFRKDYDLRFTIPQGSELRDRILQDARVQCAAKRIIAEGMLSTPSGTAGIRVNGIEPDNENRTTGLAQKVVAGTYFDEEKKGQLIIGEKLAKKLRLKLRSKVVLSLQDSSGTLVAAAFRIAGIYRTKNTPYDELNVFVGHAELADLLGMPGSVNEIAVLLHENETMESVSMAIKKANPGLLVEQWGEISPEMGLYVSAVDQMLYVFVAIILFALAFGIVNTMLMAVLERSREIGMLMAIGMNKRRVFMMILLETSFLVLSGVPFGLVFGALTNLYLGSVGIDLSVFAKAYESFGFGTTVFPKLMLRHYLQMLLLVAITAMLSSLFPARKALALNPSEAIRK